MCNMHCMRMSRCDCNLDVALSIGPVCQCKFDLCSVHHMRRQGMSYRNRLWRHRCWGIVVGFLFMSDRGGVCVFGFAKL